MWAGLESPSYARLVQPVHEDPSHEVDAELYAKFSEVQQQIDQILGLWLYQTCPNSMKKYIYRQEQYEIIKDQVSGLKILTVFGRKIDKRMPCTQMQTLKKILWRKLIKHIMDLENELLQIRIVRDELEQQGHEITSSDLFFTLYTAIQDLVNDKVGDGDQKVTAQMIRAFHIPVGKLMKEHPWNGELLYEKLMDIAETIRCDEQYANLRRKKVQLVMEEKWKFDCKVDIDAKRVPFDSQSFWKMREEETTRKIEEHKIKEAELKERKLEARRQQRKVRLGLIHPHDITVGVASEINSTEDQRSERESSDMTTGLRFVESRHRTCKRERPPVAPRGHIARHPGFVACVNERDNGKCLLQSQRCKGVHDNQIWSPNECDNPCTLQSEDEDLSILSS